MVAECALAGGLDRGTPGDRYQVVLHVDAGTLAEDADVPAGTSPPAQLQLDIPPLAPTGGRAQASETLRVTAGKCAGRRTSARNQARRLPPQ